MSKIGDYSRAKLESVIDLRVSGALSNKDDTIADNIIANTISIGTSGSDYILDVVSETQYDAEIGITQYSSVAADGPNLRFRRARGTEGVPLILSSGDSLGSISFYQHDGTNFELCGAIDCINDGTPGSNDTPAKLTFWTAPDGSNVAAQRMVINQTGAIGIGQTTPQGMFEVGSTRDALSNVGIQQNYHLVLRAADNEDDHGVGIAFARSASRNQIGAAMIFERTDGNSKGDLLFYTKQSTGDGTAPTKSMTIADSGQVTVEAGDLKVFGDDGYNGSNDRAKLILGDGKAGMYAEYGNGLTFAVAKSSGDGGLVDGSGNSVDVVRINESERVSIGHTSPSYKLDVRENRASGWAMGVKNDGDNANRYGMFIECGADNAAGTNYALGIYDGDGGSQGYIQFSGGTVTYGPFTGEHYTELEDAAEYEFGTLLKIVSVSQGPQGKSVNYTCTQTTSAKDPAVLGIYGANLQDAPGESLNEKHTVWALGDGFVLVCDEGGDISTGDYICSSNTAGHGKRQDDDLLHNYTVAKASQPVVWSEESGSQKLIACTYHCG